MRIHKNDVDSFVFGRNFLDITEFSCEEDFIQMEKDYLKEYDPYYVSIKLPIEKLSDIHFLEKNGFNFIETQIRETLKIKGVFSHIPLYPYKLELVTDENELGQVLEIASTTFKHDRYTVDPYIPIDFSGNRYQYLVRKSFENQDERLYKFFNSLTGEILGFKTHKIISENEVLMYLGGIADKYKKSPLPGISGFLELNELFRNGITKVITHISGGNYGVLNLEVKEFGYKVNQVFMVLRKIYK